MAKNDSKLLNKVSPLIEGQVPDFVLDDHPVFVKFLKQLKIHLVYVVSINCYKANEKI